MSTERQEIMLVGTLGAHMTDKLTENRHKPDWLDEDKWRMFTRLTMEVEELRDVLYTGTVEEVWREAADIANFAAFIADIVQYEKES